MRIMTFIQVFVVIWCMIHLTNNVFAEKPVITNLKKLAAGFQNPDASYGPSILWGWQGPITKEVIDRDLDRFKSLHIRSVNIEAGYDLPAPYLSDGYFELVSYAVSAAKKRVMVVWMIDECKYPSGFAGGKFSQERPDLRMQGVDYYKRIELTGGQSVSEDIPEEVLSAIAFKKDQNDFRLLKISNGKLHWTAPEGNWQVILARHRYRTSVTRAGNNPTHGKDTVNSLCDYLNPAATRQFIEFTHEQYKKHVGNEFGKTFLGFRGDEPDYGFVPWTPALPEEFIKRKGYDVRPWMAALLLKNPADSLLRVKADYWDVWSDMFGNNFFKVQADWCQENGISYMVHLNHEDQMMSLARSGGDFFEDLRHVQVPGVDAIWNQIWPGKIADFPKYASSVAHVYGRQKAMSESFAAYNTPPDVHQAKWVTDYQLVRGINLFEWMFWPASTGSEKNPRGWFADREFPQVAQYTSRISYLLSNGQTTAAIAVYYPTPSEWLGDRLSDSSALDICRILLENQRDFDFVDDYAVQNVLGKSGNGVKNRSGQVYKAVLIPSVTAMYKSTIERLKQFSESGVKVIFTGQLPQFIADRTFLDAGKPGDLSWALHETGNNVDQFLPQPDLKADLAFPSLKYNHRHFEDGELYFVFNEGDSEINTGLVLSGNGKTSKWDAVSGKISEVKDALNSDGHVRLNLTLAPWETHILVISKQ
jgi:hypothetical protein